MPVNITVVKPLTQVADTYQQADSLLASYFERMADIPAPNIFHRIASRALATRLGRINSQESDISSAYPYPGVHNTQ